MALSPGTRLGSFEIVGPLGAGGMAEVYIAEDTKLSRKVALKILPPEMASSPDRRKRFEREAKAVAALNHPNIVTIYSVEEVEGTHFITMELVRGKTLTELIARQAMPLDRFFDIAIPLSDAVSAAHQQGIIHRDLKPDNLMVNEEGRLKILDFGLAKLKQDSPSAVRSESPTVSATQAGTLLGTVAYMSPEQAEGKTVDPRSDIFSIGIILYEMATGERPFGGDSTASILSSLLRDTPRLATEVNPDLPRDLGKLIQRCLAKAADDRIQDAGDLRNELKELKREMDSGEVLEAPTPRAVSKNWVWMVPLLVVATAVATYLFMRPTPETSESELSPTGFEFTQLTTQAGAERFPSLSPDGEHVVYASRETGNWDIYLKRVGGERAYNLTEDSPADDTMPAYSPDGERIAFRSERDGGGIFIMGATGESVRRLTDFGFNPDWSPDDSEIAVATEGVVVEKSRQTKSQLWAVDVSTGTRRLITEGDAVLPSWSPHGDRIAYASLGDIWTISTEGGEPVKLTSKLTSDAGEPVWSPLGDTMYFASERGGSINIWRIPIDEATGEALGDPVPVTIGAGSRRQNISISRDGTRLAYIEENRHYNLHKYSFSPSEEVITGPPVPLTRGSRHIAFVDCSADGEWLTFHERSRGSQYDIAVIGTDGTGYRKLTDDPESDRHPRWSPDGERIAFNSRRLAGRFNIWVIRFDGSGLEPLEESGGMYAVWSPDGSFLAHQRSGGTIVLPVSETAEQPPPQVPKFGGENVGFIASSWSSDGQKLAGYRRFQDGGRNAGIVVYSFDSREFELLTEFGRNPVWLNDDRRLLFFSPDDDGLFLVASDTKQPKPLGRSGLFPALSPDNQSIYVSIPIDEADIWLLTLDEDQ